ncbi:saccharopine dehydrogenase NADP-binding domain-containing protein [Tamlana sp. 2_MG-2023]|uniref:saccharopine dehydrogenase family protein n=1 Tax=unclassified Tamlana TaxID=2614803 RepID=UPI0026E19DFB|nr:MULTISPECIES: saccharopine dehydrogenase family protein [unclassified Tamlana]MDO6760624.1 saccharopine dehydrogenase NADP-binding domain-containing protein [Tamlana sp. 2_MG-2023]MDO6790880.1 saccharopine dehydrogenase NADP-binding domain-containing protein [Tamlana sp. 1_MG-2023]
MRQILVIGSGKSTSYLIKYLLDHAATESLLITIADIHIENAERLINNHLNGNTIQLDIFNDASRYEIIKASDIVISMLPAHLHINIAKDCLKLNKNLVTASYVSPEMQALNEEVKAKGLIFMNEIGVDPGLDHMSAMKVLDDIREKGGEILSFESSTGGLIAPESDNNLWHYKFTWNPRNVVLAGQGGTAKYLKEGSYKYLPYNQLFKRAETLNIENHGRFEVYANRDSLKYQAAYKLENAKTLYRGTMRRAGFCQAWDVFVSLGMTDDSFTMDDSEHLSHRNFLNAFLPYHPSDSVESKLQKLLKIEYTDLIWKKLEALDLFNNNKYTKLEKATPAQILQNILMDSWSLSEQDKDMVVMYHKFGYKLSGKKHETTSTMVTIGTDSTYTAMAKTVGLPVAIATISILNKKITQPGVHIPITKEIYLPILTELETYGIIFNEKNRI